MSIYSPPQERAGIFDALLKPTSTWTFPAQSATSTISAALSSSQFLPTVISKATKLSLIANAAPTFAEIAAALSEGGASGLSASHPLVVSIARLSFSICEHVLATTKSIVDPRVVASLLVAISYCPDDVAPSLVRAGANDAIVMTSVSHLRTTSSSSSTATAIPGSVLSPSSSSAASSLFKDEQRSLFIAKEVPEAIKAIDEVFKNQKQQQVNVLSVTATSDLVFNLFSSRRHIGGVSKQSLVIGGLIGGVEEEERGKSSEKGTVKSEVLIESSNSSIIIEDCQDTAIFVTVSVTMLCLRRLKRCTIVCVPSSIAFNVEDCSHCTVSGCARAVTMKNCTEVKLFTLMSQFASLRGEGQTSSEERVMSIPVFGDSREVVIGPYNVCAPGIISSTPLALWASTGTAADADKHSYDTSSPTRPMLRHEYYVRYIPTAGASDSAPLHADVKEGHGSSTASRSSDSKTTESPLPVERIAPERFFANENSSSSSNGATAEEEERERLQIESDLASLDVPTAQRAELLLQSSFVTWLLEDNKASGLKNSLR